MNFLHLDEITLAHTIRVAMLAKSFGTYCNFSTEDIDNLFLGGLLHDIGKFLIPLDVLNKPKLSTEEFKLIKQHPELGHQFLKQKTAECSFLQEEVLYIVHEHHEKLNGTGYPSSLSGAEIHKLSKVIAICDIFDALVTERPYKVAFSKNKALQILSDDVKKGYIDAYLYKEFSRFIFEQTHLRELYADDIIC